MNASRTTHRALRLGCALAVLAGATMSWGQTPSRSVRGVPQPAAPAGIAPGVAGSGMPSPSGLPSPLPSPGGLTSQFPAGLPSPLPNPADSAAPAMPNPASPGTPGGSPYTGTAPQTPGTGTRPGGYGGGYGGVYGGAAPAAGVAGSGPYTALQIAESFLAADANRDGQLTRAEAQNLTIMPGSFEDMDENKDGVLSRSEYENAFAR